MNETEKKFARLDHAFASFLAGRCGLNGAQKDAFRDLVAELSYELNHGHSCIRVGIKAREVLTSSHLVSANGRTPLILEDDRLYLHRYWRYESRLAGNIRALLPEEGAGVAGEELLNRYFPPAAGETDWQRQAAELALTARFCVISGGPGTGKTTTVVKIIALLKEAAVSGLDIALAAPTGKAAMRLQDSIAQNLGALPCENEVRAAIPNRVLTLHRLLGAKTNSPFFRHDADNPLPYDLVIVDEASMVDLALMCKLTDALKPSSRLILLGDKDQLASVESGAVLADLTAALPGFTCELKKSFRFDERIKSLADAVNLQLGDEAWDILLDEARSNIKQGDHNFVDAIADRREEYLALIEKGIEFSGIHRSFNAFQVLCATRKGRYGVEEINRTIEKRLSARNAFDGVGLWYPGRPVMVTQNDAGMQLYNGDIGICLRDGGNGGKLAVFFERPDGSVKKCLPSRLPHCETVFAMTIHKSQGSEFDEVVIVLPDTVGPILTKELLYTAITRARKRVTIVGERRIFCETVKRKVDRRGGLREKLQIRV
ncbi:MAG: exodeoxyribonuclease V subunit alpha [Gammaproteobacteria bacterium]